MIWTIIFWIDFEIRGISEKKKDSFEWVPPAKLLKNLIFESPKAQKNENLLICSETSETARRPPLSVIFEESAFAPLLEAQSTEAHSRNDRLEDKLSRLERQVEEQRRQTLHLEAIPKMAKQELNTPIRTFNGNCSRKLGAPPHSTLGGEGAQHSPLKQSEVDHRQHTFFLHPEMQNQDLKSAHSLQKSLLAVLSVKRVEENGNLR